MRALLTTLGALAIAVPAMAQERERARVRDPAAHTLSPEMEQDVLQLRDRIREELKLSQQDADALVPMLREYRAQNGRGETVRAMVRDAKEQGCVGACLGEMLHATNRAMRAGAKDEEARVLCGEALRDRIRQRDEKRLNWSADELGLQVRQRFEERLAEWQRDRTRERERARAGNQEPGGKGTHGPGPKR